MVPDRQHRLPGSIIWRDKVQRHHGDPAPFADATHAVLVLLLYVAVFTAVTIWLTRSQGHHAA